MRKRKGDFIMDVLELMKERHSVRQYRDTAIEEDKRSLIDEYISELNARSGLHMIAVYDEPECFNSRLAHYGRFENVKNYIVIAGKKGADNDVKAGYYGELVVLKLQELGLRTCWVALTHGKSRAVLKEDEKEIIIISTGYGKTDGIAHRSKPVSRLSNQSEDSPEWFRRGVEGAMSAPTAVNQQRFRLVLMDGSRVKMELPRFGNLVKLDSGIVKCHLELAAGKENFEWI